MRVEVSQEWVLEWLDEHEGRRLSPKIDGIDRVIGIETNPVTVIFEIGKAGKGIKGGIKGKRGKMSKGIRLEEALMKIRDGLGEIETINEEVENWKESMEGTNLESTDKYEKLGDLSGELEEGFAEIESALESLELVEFP